VATALGKLADFRNRPNDTLKLIGWLVTPEGARVVRWASHYAPSTFSDNDVASIGDGGDHGCHARARRFHTRTRPPVHRALRAKFRRLRADCQGQLSDRPGHRRQLVPSTYAHGDLAVLRELLPSLLPRESRCGHPGGCKARHAQRHHASRGQRRHRSAIRSKPRRAPSPNRRACRATATRKGSRYRRRGADLVACAFQFPPPSASRSGYGQLRYDVRLPRHGPGS
jgi:hypothetical protein